jgi:hypothetical protein
MFTINKLQSSPFFFLSALASKCQSYDSLLRLNGLVKKECLYFTFTFSQSSFTNSDVENPVFEKIHVFIAESISLMNNFLCI